MARDLKGCRIVLTGASSGIGRALATEAAKRGARLALAARSADVLEMLAREMQSHGADTHAVPADVTVEADRKHLIQTAGQRLGGIDVLINNAGVSSFGHFADSTEEILRRIMEVNFFAPVELTRLAVPHLLQGRQPAVVNVSSMCGRRGLPAWTEYSASKFALCGWTEALRAELARFDIDVLLIVPGLTRSDLPRHLLRNEGRMRIEFGRGMPPELVATRILAALQRNRSETVLGTEARLMLLVNRFLPGLVDRLLKRRVRQLYAQPPALVP